jgi:hypothetical protein
VHEASFVAETWRGSEWECSTDGPGS